MNGSGAAEDDEPRGGEDALVAHVADCSACRVAPPPVERIAVHLDAVAVPLDAVALSSRTFQRLQPEIGRLAAAAIWRRAAAGFMLAVLPLPLVLVCNAYLLHLVYVAASAVVPPPLAAYLIASYAAFLVLLFAATYAAIPLCLARRSPTGRPILGWGTIV